MSVQLFLAMAAVFVTGLTLQGCDSNNTPADPSSSCSDDNSTVLQFSSTPAELLVDSAMSVRVVALPANSSKAYVNYSGCALASVANGDVGPDGHGSQQYKRLTLNADSISDGVVPTATVYGVPLNQVVARNGAAIVADFTLFGYGSDMGLPLNITASGGSSITVRTSEGSDILEGYVEADAATIDLGNITGTWSITITASNGGLVTGALEHYSSKNVCSSGGRIEIWVGGKMNSCGDSTDATEDPVTMTQTVVPSAAQFLGKQGAQP